MADVTHSAIGADQVEGLRVFCAFVRYGATRSSTIARASNLIISPEDLLQAVSYMPALRLGGISQRLFPSGLTVLQDDAVDDASSAAGLVVAANTQEASGIACITVDQAAKYLKLSAVLGHEQLLAAEPTGALVRDETLESLRFISNRFQEFVDALH
jgi:hypothetical protein